ncbi:cupin domain-containing protein [Dactylosporangium sp. NPDC000521]|uniref:cupin domain-containing protein n=1 Tax=Dactylosporangium sp. NPDC000521 TaxID=3363975 RepID=UPI0036827963
MKGSVKDGAGLPAGVEVYALTADGTALLTSRTGRGDLLDPAELLPFIDSGQHARYLIGDALTSPERPSNATYKLGLMRGHSAFTPHAHGGEHFVLSLGYAACGLYDDERQEAVTVRLTPGVMLRIPALLPHSFINRGDGRLLILAANTGFGIDHDDYAITAEEAERRAAAEPPQHGDLDYPALAKALRAVGEAPSPGGMTLRERAARAARRLAVRLEGSA